MIRYLLVPILLLQVATLSADPGAYSLLKVEDGDTLVIDLDGNPTRVQLVDIDAPEEITNPKLTRDAERTGIDANLLLELGRRATQHLQQWVRPGMDVMVEGNLKQKDKYGRIPVIVSLPGTKYSLNSIMVKQGYAIALGGYPTNNHDKSELLQLEEQARNEKAGLWKSNPELMAAWSGRSDKPR